MKKQSVKILSLSMLAALTVSGLTVPAANAAGANDPLVTPNKNLTSFLLDPTDDAHVRSGTYSGDNYAYNHGLAWLGPDKDSEEMLTFVKYNPRQVPGLIKSGTVELIPQISGTWGDYSGGTYYLSSAPNTWEENTITYKNKPKALKELGYARAVAGGSKHKFALTSAMIADLNAGKELSFQLSEKDSYYYVTHRSKEGGNPIRLRLEIEQSQSKETKTSSWNHQYPRQDAIVNNKIEPMAKVRGSTNLDYATSSYLTFDIANIDVTKAQKINVRGSFPSWTNDVASVSVYSIKEKVAASNIIRETKLTRGTKAGTIKGLKGDKNWYTLDVTNAIREAKAKGDKTLTFAFVADHPTTYMEIMTPKNESGNFLYPFLQTKNNVIVPLPKQKTQIVAKAKPTTTAKTTYASMRYAFTSKPSTMYTGTTASKKKVMSIANGQQVKYLARSGSYTKITYGTKTGWVLASTLENRNKRTTTVATTKTTVASTLSTSYIVNMNTAVKQSNPNVLREWNTSKTLATANNGTKVSFLGAGRIWSKIKVGNTTGYVYNSQVTKKSEYKVTAVTTKKSVSAWVFTTKTIAPGYNGTTASKKKVMSIPKGKIVTHISSNGNWKKVKYGTVTGWVDVKYLS